MSEIAENTTESKPIDQKIIPNATAVLVLGICSIFPGCICYGVPGVACAIIALVLNKKAMALYKANPDAFKEGSFKNLNAGRICAIIGACTSGILFLILLFMIIFYGPAVLGGMSMMGAASGF